MNKILCTEDYNKATRLLNNHRYEKAAILLKRELKLVEYKEAHLNLANCYKFLNETDKCLYHYNRANDPSIPHFNGQYAPEYTLALNNSGLIEFGRGNTDEAISRYRRAVSIDASYTDAWWNLSTALLRKACSGLESFDEGLKLYNYRFTRVNGVKLKSDVTLKLWEGERGRIIVLHEQGIGDGIMWSRYFPWLKTFGDVIVQCEPANSGLYGVESVFLASDAKADYAIPFGSLMERHYKMVGNMGSVDTSEFCWTGGSDRIGVVWSGSKTHANDANRSTYEAYFHRFSKYGELWSLNPAVKSRTMKNLGAKDWGTTIEFLKTCKYVISIDTSIVHLCGKLNVPCYMIQPAKETDFRWGEPYIGGSNLWYPSVKVIPNHNSFVKALDLVEGML